MQDAKEGSDTVKASVKKHYKVKDMTNEANFEAFMASLPDAAVQHASSKTAGADIVKHESFKNVEVFKNVTVSDLAGFIDQQTLASYLYCFILLIHVYDAVVAESESSDGEDTGSASTLFDTVMAAISGVQHKQDVTHLLDEILDDDIKQTIVNLKSVMNIKPTAEAQESHNPDMPAGLEGLANMLENSKIANLAKEITDDIDLSKIKVDKPEDMFKVIADQNIMGDIIGKVGNKIQQKLQQGDIKQEDFVKEAMGMLGSMKGNPMFANIMKTLNTGEMQKMSTRDRLRKKYEQKRSQA